MNIDDLVPGVVLVSSMLLERQGFGLVLGTIPQDDGHLIVTVLWSKQGIVDHVLPRRRAIDITMWRPLVGC